MASIQETCTYNTYDEFATHFKIDLDNSLPDQHQLNTINPYTITDISTSKSKGKRKKKAKHSTTEVIKEAFLQPVVSQIKTTQKLSILLSSLLNQILTYNNFLAFIPNTSGKEKRTKTQDNEASYIITEYQAPFRCTFIYDIILYDISAKLILPKNVSWCKHTAIHLASPSKKNSTSFSNTAKRSKKDESKNGSSDNTDKSTLATRSNQIHLSNFQSKNSSTY
ncbi:hypothetical protein RCL_jg14894.t1 [Rhizophagus clarus]|uniref:Uncharacterized protein n=1 Tax=Rhizophagus clarus TaxID=94130 RepID=A0A8H3QYB2_9GLOM|nr:hypothetical protein RCL_jg14894.t1 [Rhizophagus clarus]